MADFEVTGTQQFVKLAQALNAQGSAGRGLKKELMTAIKDAAKPMEKEVRDHVAQYLPDRYAPIISKGLVVRPSQSTRGKSVGLKLVGYAPGQSRRRQIRVIDGGTLRHPVYGNREAWVDQKVKPGFWSEPLEAARDKPAVEIRRAIQKTISKLD
jgi:hypothetical protein